MSSRRPSTRNVPGASKSLAHKPLKSERTASRPQALVAIVMGSRSDWATLQHAANTLTQLGVAHHVEVVSAHRTPDKLFAFAEAASAQGFRYIIAGAGGAAHLPGMLAAKTSVPILGVPVQSAALNGMDSLLSIVQMPAGIPVATFAIGPAGAVNAALFAAQCLAMSCTAAQAGVIDKQIQQFRAEQTAAVLAHSDPRVPVVTPAERPG